MTLRSLLWLTSLFFLVGCHSFSAKPTAAPITQAKEWVFPMEFQKGSPFPEEFAQVQTKDGCTLYVFSPKEYGDLTLITHFKPNYGKNDFGGGLLFRYQNPENYYCLRFNGNTNNLRFYKSIDGDRARFANRTVRLKDKNNWHELKVIARGDLLQAYVDNRLIFSREDEIIGSGKIGLWLRGENPKTEFADLTVQP